MTSGSSARFRQIAELGRGGMSRVYLALTEPSANLPKLIVAKVLLEELARDSEFVQMFFDEARLSARLDHPNVVKIYDVDADCPDPYMLLEYLDGASLESLVRRSRDSGGIPLPLHLHAIAQAAHGLHYAHDLSDADGKPLRIVHRDVSPHNVFVTFEGAVKVLDFGIAKAADSSHTTKTGVVKGKFAYMAPEQVKDAKNVDRRVDIFALGVMTWQAAAKRRPWQGLSEIEIIRELLKSGLPPVSTPEAPVDPALVAIVEKATALNRDARYATAAEFVHDLERYLATLPEKAGPRRLGAWGSALMVERRTKVAQVIDNAMNSTARLSQSGESSVSSVSAVSSVSSMNATLSGVASIPSLTPTPASSSIQGMHSQAPRPMPTPSVPPVSRSGANPVHTHSGTAVMQSSTFTGTTPRGMRTDQTAVSALQPVPGTTPQEKRRNWPLVVASAAIALSIAVVATVSLTGSSSGQTNGGGATASVPPEPQLITLSLSATPSEAKFFIDGAPLIGNPTQARFPRDGSEHKIRVEAAGYRPASQTVKYDDATKNISITLASQR